MPDGAVDDARQDCTPVRRVTCGSCAHGYWLAANRYVACQEPRTLELRVLAAAYCTARGGAPLPRACDLEYVRPADATHDCPAHCRGAPAADRLPYLAWPSLASVLAHVATMPRRRRRGVP